MDVTELVALTEWIEREIKAKRLTKLYAGLTNILQNNASGQPAQPFADQLKSLTTALADVDLAELSLQQLEFLDLIGIRQALGRQAVEKIEEILYKNSLDIATANQLVREMAEMLQAGIGRSDQIRESLSSVVEGHRVDLEGQVLVRVAFRADASIENIVDLKRWANEWHDIGRGLAFATGVRPQDIRIVGAQNGSIILDLAVTYGVAKVINRIILECLAVAQGVVDLLMKVEELKGMKIKNKQALLDLEKEAAQSRADAVSEIASRVPAMMDAAADGEKQAVVEKAVKKLIAFLEKGGTVDCVVPKLEEGSPEPSGRDELTELRDQAKQIRALERSRALLEYFPAANDDSRSEDTD